MIDFKVCIYRVSTIFPILFISFPSPSFQNSLQSLAWRRSLCRLPVATSFTSDAWVAGCRRWPKIGWKGDLQRSHAKPEQDFGPLSHLKISQLFHIYRHVTYIYIYIYMYIHIYIYMYIYIYIPYISWKNVPFFALFAPCFTIEVTELGRFDSPSCRWLEAVLCVVQTWQVGFPWDFTSNFIGKKLWDPIQCFFLGFDGISYRLDVDLII